LRVYAVADGYVSRIKISLETGKQFILTHPNGYTSVYCHLKSAKVLNRRIKKTHYKEQSFEIEMFFKPDELQ
jgi:murein DD-endopeptidase MepM/ murein hydrolase activator NlpD